MGQDVLLSGSGSTEHVMLSSSLWRFTTSHQKTQILGSQGPLLAELPGNLAVLGLNSCGPGVPGPQILSIEDCP